ncbi:MAG: hypothetical protein JXA74_15995, partial [Anaerolineae bacterium]|nr:hypothetical protein [Anaerolineae bacterium]
MRGASLRLSIWSRAILALLLSALMRAMWMLPVLELALGSRYVQPGGVHYPLGMALVVLLGGAGLAALWRDRSAGPIAGAAVGLLISVGSVLYLLPAAGVGPVSALARLAYRLLDLREAIPAELVVLLGTAGLWVTGLKSGWQSHNALWRSFLAGTLVLSMLVLAQLGDSRDSITLLAGRVLGFTLSGLLALALLGSRHARDPLQRGSVNPPALNRYWLMTVSLVILMVVVLGWVLGKLISPQAVREIWGALRPIWGTLLAGLRLILLAIAYLLARLLRPLIGLFSRNQAALEPFELAPPQEFEPFQEQPGLAMGLPLWVRTGLGIGLALALLAGLIGLSVWAWRRRVRIPEGEGYLEERDSIWTFGLLA